MAPGRLEQGSLQVSPSAVTALQAKPSVETLGVAIEITIQ